MGILDDMKTQIASSGGAAKGFFGLRDGEKKKIRFITEVDEATKVLIHDKWGEYSVLCQDHLGLDCHWDGDDGEEDDDGKRQIDKEFFAWQIWNYEEKAIEIFIFRANENSPVPRMIEFYEVYGTLKDRDYTCARTGSRFQTSYGLIPHDKKSFKHEEKAKLIKNKKLMKRLAAKYPTVAIDEEDDVDDDDSEDDDDD